MLMVVEHFLPFVLYITGLWPVGQTMCTTGLQAVHRGVYIF